jgi:hypothetical protein
MTSAAADPGAGSDAVAVLPWHQPASPSAPWAPTAQPQAPGAPAVVPVAWAARTSDEEAQDPTLSLPRQLARARAAMPPGFVIVAHFFDIESGRMELAQRGQGDAYAQFDIPIPRDGGINELMTEARRPDRRFVAVVCESIDRISRITRIGTTIEWELEPAGVALLAVDEGIRPELVAELGGGDTGRPKKATPILTRRVKQAISEWYVLNMLELSWEGFIQHTIQGWNVGKPPYGYLPQKVPHPVPARRAEGRTKHRLVPDPARGPVITRIFQLRVVERLGYDTIADRLNADPDRNPPPEPVDPARAVGGGPARRCGRSCATPSTPATWCGTAAAAHAAAAAPARSTPPNSGPGHPSRHTNRWSPASCSTPPHPSAGTGKAPAPARRPTSTRRPSGTTCCAPTWSMTCAAGGWRARAAAAAAPTTPAN